MGAERKLLILSPPFTASGGVSTYVMSLKGHWPAREKYFFRGNTGRNPIARLLLTMKGYIAFCMTCLFSPGYKNVFVNTSMDRKAITRDNLFIWIAWLLGRRVTVFIHGWDQAFFDACPAWKLSGLFRAGRLFVLSDDFKTALKKRGYKKDIFVETTVVADEFIRCFDEAGPSGRPQPHILYLARLEPEKGIMTLLEAFRELSARHPGLRLNIAGSGSLEREVSSYIAREGLQNITYHGLVRGQEKAALFKESQIYVLPTTHGEGLPISVLEAMAAGMVVVTSSAGALNGFFRDGDMGYKLGQVTREQVTGKLEEAIRGTARAEGISRFNFAYARQHFTVKNAIGRMEKQIWRE